MDTSKIVSRLDAIENHAERLKEIEDLLEKLLDDNRRQTKALEQMLQMYVAAAEAQRRTTQFD
jgi:hypothetical protein